MIEDASAVYDKKTLYMLYRIATDEASGFLHIKLTSRDKDDMFYSTFSQKLMPHP